MDTLILTAIERFRSQLLQPLYHDITCLLDCAWSAPTPDNHGANFLGSLSVLMAIETIATYTANPNARSTLEQQQEEFERSLSADVRKNLKRLYIPRRVDGSPLAKAFIQRYLGAVDNRYSNDSTVGNLWSYRNPQAHSFIPPHPVRWPYKLDPLGVRRVVTIRMIEDDAKMYSHFSGNHLLGKQGFFLINPHILFIDLKKAVELFLGNLKEDPDGESARNFIRNVEHLLP